MPSMRRAFNMSVWHILRNVEMVKDIDTLWDAALVICMINEVWEIRRLKIVKCETITVREVVEIAFQEERVCKRRV